MLINHETMNMKTKILHTIHLIPDSLIDTWIKRCLWEKVDQAIATVQQDVVKYLIGLR